MPIDAVRKLHGMAGLRVLTRRCTESSPACPRAAAAVATFSVWLPCERVSLAAVASLGSWLRAALVRVGV